MANERWTERERDWRGASDRHTREERGFNEGHNPAGPAQSYGGGEDRSWSAGGRDRGERYYGDYGARNYGDGGPTGYPRQDYLGDARRFGQGGYDRDRYGEDRYGNQGRSGEDYGYDRSNRYYGAEWSDRDSYDTRRADYGSGNRYGQGRDDYRGGGYGEYGQRQSGRGSQLGVRDTGFGDPNPYVQAASDGERQGEHRGRGPADYRRSDDRIREDVNDRLTDDAHIDASGIQVAVKDGEVTLSGTVDSRFAKRHAEDLADRISGAKHVQNNLRVRDGDSRGAPTTAGAATTGSTTSGRA
ncbi:MAG: hypothetical protein K0R83_1806 [Caulobacter sp.]|jgi:osmotically-inducible protein OsmY|nr:hypothetical protein [Caulobacter sp.]